MMRGPAERASRQACTGRICAALLVASHGLAVLGQQGASKPARVEPTWVVEAPGVIRWIDLSPVGDPPIVYFGTEDAAYRVAWAGGQSQQARVVRGRDLRRAQHGGEGSDAPRVVVFDRYSIHGLRDESAPPAWSFRDDPGDIEAHRGDPETLPRWLDAGVCDERVIAVNSDGRVVLLDVCSGELRGRLDLGPLPVAKLQVSGECGVIVARARGQTFAAFVRTGDTPDDVRRVEVGGPWPVWSSLAGETLVTVDSVTLRVVRGDGLLCEHPFGTPRPAPSSCCRIDEARVAVLGEGAVRAMDVSTGVALWSTPIDGLSSDTFARLRFDGGMLVVQSTRAAWLLEPTSGRVVLRLAGPVEFVQVAGGRVETLHASRSPPGWLAGRRRLSDDDGPLDTWRLSAQEAAGPASPPMIRWRADTLVVGLGRSIAIYQLKPARGR